MQLQALREAQEEEDYDSLIAQIAKSVPAGVEQKHIEVAKERLKALKAKGLHVNEMCSHEKLRENMFDWDKNSQMESLRYSS